ncbi:Oxygen-insensitive NADPH nitroreductase [Imhoffiella purpurea]|uniref:Oxygen-insensitive NADPH nitroreductase n=1 Tax=Imhoffiella purpurea TaxID=1249627 RepID=W9VCZ4_9GAMM|nr:Oxygen-insensitive NADPH nitroreductase [Imhoffiella purpurea]
MAQNLSLAAESLGLGCVFIGAIRNDPDRVAELLELPDLVAPLFGLCLGWPADDPLVKPRLPRQVILHQDVYRDPLPQTMADYDARMAEYYSARPTNRRSGNWSVTTAAALQGKKREGLLEFLRGRGFFRR